MTFLILDDLRQFFQSLRSFGCGHPRVTRARPLQGPAQRLHPAALHRRLLALQLLGQDVQPLRGSSTRPRPPAARQALVQPIEGLWREDEGAASL